MLVIIFKIRHYKFF